MRWKQLAVGTAVAVAVLAPAKGVSAHAGLEASVPSPNAVLEAGPPNIELDFNEAVDAELANIELYDQNATLIPTAFSFQVGVQSGVDIGALIDRVSGNATASSTVGRLETSARLLSLIGLVVLIGGGLLTVQLAGHTASAASDRMLLWMAWMFLLVGSLGSFGLYGAKVVSGSPSDALKPSVWRKVADSHTASILLVRVVLVLVVAGLLLTFARRARDLWRGAALVVGTALILTYSSIGHANAQHPAALWIGIDAVHLTAISVWIGGLLMLAFGTPGWLTDPGSERIVRRFSVMAIVAVPLIVATGVAQTLKLAGNLDDVTSTSWGRTLVVKVAIATVLVALGGVSQWLLRNDGPSALKRNVLVEALVGIAVVGLAAALVTLPPQPVAASKVFTATLTSTTLDSGVVIADVTVTPGRVGQNEVHLVITSPGGSIAPVVSTTVEAEQQLAGTGPIPATLQAIGPNHYTGTIVLSVAGNWTLQITVEPTSGQSVVLNAILPIPA